MENKLLAEKKLPILICGATALGVAAVVRLGDRAVLVEKSGLAAWEFAASFEPGEGPWEALLPEGRELQAELVRRAVLSSRGTHIQGAAPVFFRIIRDRGIQVRFLTQVADIRRQDGAYAVTLVDSAGLHTMLAAAILDTTSSGETHLKQVGSFRRSLNAALAPACPGFQPPVSGDSSVSLVPGNFADEYYLRYPLEPADTLTEARRKLFSFWEGRKPGLAGWRIAAVSPFLSVRAAPGTVETDGRWIWAPSSACRNLLEAYETGLRLPVPGLEEH